MINPAQSPLPERPHLRGSLASTIVRTLLILTLFPLILLASAAYIRARTLLRDQVIEQNQRLIATQLEEVDKSIKIKEIRLDRLSRRGEFISAMESALHANRQGGSFPGIRKDVLNQFQSLSKEEKPTFNQFVLMESDGLIQVSTKQEWEGVTISLDKLLEDQDPSIDALLGNADHRSIMIYDFKPLYPDQLVLLTIVKYKTTSGSLLGLIVGITEAQSLQETLTALTNLSPSSDASYILPSGIFLIPNTYTNELEIANTSSSEKDIILKALNPMMETVGSNIKPVSVQYRSIDDSRMMAQAQWLPSINSGIILATPEDRILGQLNGLALFTLGLIAVSLIAMGLVIWWGSNTVIQPIRKLADITHRFSAGDWSQRADVKSTDEVGELSASFNQMADQLSEVYRSLEQKVDERTKELLTAAEVAQNIIGSTNLDELLSKTVKLIVEQFGFYHAGIFLLDRAGKNATLRAAYSPAAEAMLAKAHTLVVGSASIIGWVTANNKSRAVSDVVEDPIHFKNVLLPETRSEVGVPISVGHMVLGALDVQSKEPNAFGPATVNIVMLQTLANQIATAIQNIGLAESAQVNVQELERLYRASRIIAEATSNTDAINKTTQVLRDSQLPYVMLLRRMDGQLYVHSYTRDFFDDAKLGTALDHLNANIPEVTRTLFSGPALVSEKETQKYPTFQDFVAIFRASSGAFLPIRSGEELTGVMIMLATKQPLNYSTIQPYVNLIDLLGTTLEKIESAKETQLHLTEMEALTELSQVISVTSSLESFYESLHNQVRKLIGDYSFIIALYDEKTNSISIPYTYEDGVISSIEPFPLGQGLTSILIHTKQPLLLIEDTENRAAELGARIVGKPARSWMGTPLLVQNQPVGALIIQDPDREHAFNEDNLRFFTALASQVAGVIHNVLLLDESQQRTLQLQTASEIARDISSSLNMDELLLKAVNLIRERFNFYHAGIFLLDLAGEFIVIREATGEAGAQLKRQGYKLAVGSKSIMGYVASHGEPLVVNDTAADATFLPNLQLPDTRAEATLPLKAGERILGILDVQSSKPHSFTEDNLRTLQILADQLAIGIANTELFAETQEHLSQHRLLHHITTTTASGTTLEEALESAVTGLQVSLGGDRVAILLADIEKKYLDVKAAVGYSEEISQMRISIGSGVTGWAAAHRRPLRIDNVAEDARYIEASSNTRSELAIPLIYRNELLGVLNVESEQLSAYTENDQEMLGTLGGSLAAIIANARLLEQIRSQAERERVLFEITSKIRRSTDIETIMMTTANELMRVVGARHTKVSLGAPKENGNSTTKADVEL